MFFCLFVIITASQSFSLGTAWMSIVRMRRITLLASCPPKKKACDSLPRPFVHPFVLPDASLKRVLKKTEVTTRRVRRFDVKIRGNTLRKEGGRGYVEWRIASVCGYQVTTTSLRRRR
ncbi:hypothetical protein F4776DRAFT_317268 [Hypoxylon sp. NC0597]|nr:hypothetical protein F4776DRAFT_317268 [Hypoxylon sp. NC0597]